MGNCVAAIDDDCLTEKNRLAEENEKNRNISQSGGKRKSRVRPFGGFWGGSGAFGWSTNPGGLGRGFASVVGGNKFRSGNGGKGGFDSSPGDGGCDSGGGGGGVGSSPGDRGDNNGV